MRSIVMRPPAEKRRALTRRSFVALCAGVVLLCAPSAIRSAQLESYALIAHDGTAVEGMSLDRLRRIYRGDQQYWPDGTKVVVLIQRTGSEERRAVLDAIFRMSEARYKRFWITRIFRGDVTSGPKVVADSRSLMELVRTVPGSIGIIRSDDVPSDVQVVAIDGKLPGDGGYALD